MESRLQLDIARIFGQPGYNTKAASEFEAAFCIFFLYFDEDSAMMGGASFGRNFE